MSSTSRAGALATIAAGLAGLAWFVVYLTPVSLGFEDTDNPVTSLRFLRDYPDSYQLMGMILILLGIVLTVAVLNASDVLSARAGRLAVRSTTAFGLIAAALFFLYGVIVSSVQPLLYVDSLSSTWGEATYLILQFVGLHTFGQGAITALAGWAVAVCLIGLRTRAIPLIVIVLGLVPAFRLVGLLIGSLGIEADALWIFAISSIPGVMVWTLILGVVLLRRSLTTTTPSTPGPTTV